jgi:hypothetical protein
MYLEVMHTTFIYLPHDEDVISTTYDAGAEAPHLLIFVDFRTACKPRSATALIC